MAGSTDERRPLARVSTLQRIVEEWFANAFFRSLLRSPLHWAASNWLAVLSYAGRRSGQRYVFPVAYKQRDGELIVGTPKRESNWWVSFQRPHQCTVWLRGIERPATGEVVAGDECEPLLLEYFDAYGMLGRVLGTSNDIATSPERIPRAKRDLAVVRFTLDEA